MAISGDKTINATISASSSVQTWNWTYAHQNFFIQNLTAGSNTAADTILYFDNIATITTASTTAIRLLAGQSIDYHQQGGTTSLSFYSTGTINYQIFPN